MAKKKVSKLVKRRLRIYFLISIAVISIGVIAVVSNIYKIHSLRKEESELNNKLDNLHTEEKELSSEIGKLKDPDYIAKYAREKFYYTKDGEYVIKIQDDNKVDTDNIVEVNRSYYIIGLAILLLTIFIIFIKSRIKKKNK